MQGGRGTGGKWDSAATLTFPIAFTEEPGSITGSIAGAYWNNTSNVYFRNVTATSANVITGFNGNNAEARTYSWMACGY